MNLTTIYDQNMRLLAYLENATNISYKRKLNDLWEAGFTLPADDPKNDYCQPFNFVRIYDGDKEVGLFRIIQPQLIRSNGEKVIQYQCEHVLATLVDDVLFRYHQIGGAGISTADVLEYILSHQTVQRWRLGQVDFTYYFEYKFENEPTLLAALFSVPKPFIEAYQWIFDTSSYPWTLNFVRPDDSQPVYIRYGRNLINVERTIDATKVVTRLYALGYGEGVNQLGIESVNPTGQPYIDADTQAQFGIISDIFVDRRIENAETLYNTAKAHLEQVKIPPVSYKVQAADLYRITNNPLDEFVEGKLAKVRDNDLGLEFEARVVSVAKNDVNGAPGDVTLEIANRAADIAVDIAEQKAKQRIFETYSQGATNIDSHDFADNCDPEHPAVLRFYVPEEAVRVNKVLLTYRAEAFRAYSRAAKDGGGGVVSSRPVTGEEGLELDFTWNETEPAADGHKHEFKDYHIDQTFFRGHTHEIQLPNHRHDIDYGIYQGPTPTAVTVAVDGNVVPGLGTDETDVNLVDYLAKDSEGKIARGQWHEITITPNDLGRIVASVIVQLFVQSKGGGDY